MNKTRAPHTFDSPRHRKQKLDHLWRHSIPDYQVRPVPSPASSSRPAAMEADASLPPRDLLTRDKQERHRTNARYVRKDGVHAKGSSVTGRKPPRRTNLKPSVGSFPLPTPPWDRDWDGPTPGNLNKWKAVEAMLSAGYLKKPSCCTSCHHGSLQGRFERYNVALEGIVFTGAVITMTARLGVACLVLCRLQHSLSWFQGFLLQRT